MCEHCRTIQTWRKFDAPKDYLACIAYIQKLVEQSELELMPEESTCPLEQVRTGDSWADEIISPHAPVQALRADLHLCGQHPAGQRPLQKRQELTGKAVRK